eukprot:637342-Ditylum_brightwellii.AAC.1
MEARTDSSAPSRVSASSTNGCPSSSCGGAVAGVVAAWEVRPATVSALLSKRRKSASPGTLANATAADA